MSVLSMPQQSLGCKHLEALKCMDYVAGLPAAARAYRPKNSNGKTGPIVLSSLAAASSAV